MAEFQRHFFGWRYSTILAARQLAAFHAGLEAEAAGHEQLRAFCGVIGLVLQRMPGFEDAPSSVQQSAQSLPGEMVAQHAAAQEIIVTQRQTALPPSHGLPEDLLDAVNCTGEPLSAYVA